MARRAGGGSAASLHAKQNPRGSPHAGLGISISWAWAREQSLPSADRLLRHRQQAFALSTLAGQLAGAANGFGLLTGALLGRLFIMHVPLHFAERAFALHLLLQGFQRLVDIIVADENLNQGTLSFVRPAASRAAWRTK